MNNYLKTSFLLLFTAGCFSPLLGQKKLALANECFNAQAYYLASRYYQAYFDKSSDDCHPDQIKLAQSLAATQQLTRAEAIFETYMNCQGQSSADHIAYGKFLIDIKAYQKAIPYFERAMHTEPQLARHYLLVCQTALPKEESSTTVLIKQDIKPSESIMRKELNSEVVLVRPTTQTNISTLTSTTDRSQTNLSASTVKPYESSKPIIEIETSRIVQPVKTNLSREISKTTEKTSTDLVTENRFSSYGVRLGTYKPSSIPNLSSVEGFGRIEKRKWNGKIIFFLVDFPDRVTAEETVKLAIQKNFKSATLVEKLSSGRMKSVR